MGRLTGFLCCLGPPIGTQPGDITCNYVINRYGLMVGSISGLVSDLSTFTHFKGGGELPRSCEARRFSTREGSSSCDFTAVTNGVPSKTGTPTRNPYIISLCGTRILFWPKFKLFLAFC